MKEKNSESMINIQEARNTLLYSLLIDAPTRLIKAPKKNASAAKIDKWLRNAYKKASTACKDFNKSHEFFRVIPPKVSCDFSFLEHADSFWRFILMQEAVLFSYDVLRKLLAEQNQYSIKDFRDCTLPYGPLFLEEKNTDIFGLCYLLNSTNNRGNHLAELNDSGHFDMRTEFNISPLCKIAGQTKLRKKAVSSIKRAENVKEFTDDDEQRILNEITANKDQLNELHHKYKKYLDDTGADQLNRKVKTLYNRLSTISELDFLSFNPKLCNGKDILNQLNTLELCQFLRDERGRKEGQHPSNKIKHLLSSFQASRNFKSAAYNAFKTEYLDLISELEIEGLYGMHAAATKTPSQDNQLHLKLADKVYLRYQLEKILPISAIDCMYKNISHNNEKDFLYHNLEAVAQYALLPNVFSRQYILQMAIDILGKPCLPLYTDYGSGNKEIGMLSARHKGWEDYSDRERNDYWLKKYGDLISILGNFLFPIFNNCFFVILWNSIRNKCTSDEECMKRFFILLSRYLNDKKMVSNLLSLDSCCIKNDSISTPLPRSLTEKAIHPFPNPAELSSSTQNSDDKIDYHLYQQCILTIKSVIKERHTSSQLINRKYIKSLYDSQQTDVKRFLYTAAKMK